MENPAPRSFDFSHVVVHKINTFPFLILAQYGDRRGYRTDNAHIIEPTWKSRTALQNGFILSNPHYSIATTRCIEDRDEYTKPQIVDRLRPSDMQIRFPACHKLPKDAGRCDC